MRIYQRAPLRAVSVVVLFVLTCVVMVAPAKAQIVEVQGMATLETRSKKLNSSEMKILQDMALKDALNRYIASLPPAEQKLFIQNQSRIVDSISSFITNVTIVENSYNRSTKTHTLVVRGSLNRARLDVLVSTANEQNPMALTFFFVARQTSSVKRYSDRNVVVRENEQAGRNSEDQSGSERSTINSNSASVDEEADSSYSKQSLDVTTSGGSTLKKSDQRTYVVSSPENINAVMLNLFTTNGFDVYDYKDVVSYCGGRDATTIYPEFADSDELSAATRKAIFSAAVSCDIDIFAVGTLDIGLSDIDPVTGSNRVYVSVRAQAYSLEGRIPRVIASIGPVQYAGLGPDSEVASREALKLAAHEAARTLSAQLLSR